jgi:hypothetical protein
MANEPMKKIKVTADSELGKLVDEARRHPVLLEKDGAVYSLTPHRYLISRGSWQLSGSSLILRCAKEVDQRFQH